MTRPLYEIAYEIRKTWTKISPYAEPYVEAMESLVHMHNYYLLDSAHEIVLKFLSNANTWRGEDARRIKAELKQMAGI